MISKKKGEGKKKGKNEGRKEKKKIIPFPFL